MAYIKTFAIVLQFLDVYFFLLFVFGLASGLSDKGRGGSVVPMKWAASAPGRNLWVTSLGAGQGRLYATSGFKGLPPSVERLPSEKAGIRVMGPE